MYPLKLQSTNTGAQHRPPPCRRPRTNLHLFFGQPPVNQTRFPQNYLLFSPRHSPFKICNNSNGYSPPHRSPLRMNSLWLCVDADAAEPPRMAKRLPRSRSCGVQPPVLGIFTDEPAIIAKRLPRPLTPFVPAPEPVHVRCDAGPAGWEESATTDGFISPPRESAFEFGTPKYSEVGFGISIF
jgi:hypothetical protein